VKILKNCYKALSNNGKVIVLEEVLPTGIKSDLRARVAYNMDLTVLATCPGGRERNKEEFEYLARAAGFARLDIKHKLTECCVIEIYKF
jgi:caffeic acid 3-O-methyltransferase